MSASFNAIVLQSDFVGLPQPADRPADEQWLALLTAPLVVTVMLVPAGYAGEVFYAWLTWTTYPGAAPSVKLFDAKTGSPEVPNAWPNHDGRGPFRPPPTSALCCNYTSEGFAMHPEYQVDVRYQWTGEYNKLLWVIDRLQHDLSAHFIGRAG